MECSEIKSMPGSIRKHSNDNAPKKNTIFPEFMGQLTGRNLRFSATEKRVSFEGLSLTK